MKTKTKQKKVKDLLTSSRKWTKGTLARDNQGHPVSTGSKAAVRFCLVGAIFHIYWTYEKANKAISKLERLLEKLLHEKRCIGAWNDDPKTKFKDVKELVEKANV